MSILSTRSVKPVHLAAAVALVAAGTWGGSALAAGSDAKPSSDDTGTVTSSAGQRAAGPAYVYKKKDYTVGAGSSNSATVFCPRGYKVSGGGVQTATTDLVVNETRPADGGDSDSVADDGWISYTINPSGAESAATTWAVCAKV